VILPDIVELQHDDRRAVIRLAVPQDAEVFRGHFPDMPVLPGVVQIDWVMRLASRCFQLSKPVADDFQVKFSRIIGPGVALVLTLELDPVRHRLNFEYRVNDQIMSSGRVKLESVP
jgi:3-hydroxymyristoyl/3-hydroxydecanoyl-(acyl carrier protein) dehydratase